jgi:hypothetical protein
VRDDVDSGTLAPDLSADGERGTEKGDAASFTVVGLTEKGRRKGTQFRPLSVPAWTFASRFLILSFLASVLFCNAIVIVAL